MPVDVIQILYFIRVPDEIEFAIYAVNVLNVLYDICYNKLEIKC